jgi:hypothetical protein
VDAAEQFVAFVSQGRPPCGLEVRVNFGLFASREATQAEIDDLGRRLLQQLDAVSIVAERRYEVSEDAEATVHQVRIEVEPDLVPADERAAGELQGRLLGLAEGWANACIAERHAAV